MATKEKNSDTKLLKKAYIDAALQIATECYDPNDEPINPSRRHKIIMNRFFREVVRDNFLPFPEVDNAFERLRSWLVIQFTK